MGNMTPDHYKKDEFNFYRVSTLKEWSSSYAKKSRETKRLNWNLFKINFWTSEYRKTESMHAFVIIPKIQTKNGTPYVTTSFW